MEFESLISELMDKKYRERNLDIEFETESLKGMIWMDKVYWSVMCEHHGVDLGK